MFCTSLGRQGTQWRVAYSRRAAKECASINSGAFQASGLPDSRDRRAAAPSKPPKVPSTTPGTSIAAGKKKTSCRPPLALIAAIVLES